MLISNIILSFLIQIIVVDSKDNKNKILPDYDLIITGSYEQDEIFYVGENIKFTCFLTDAINPNNDDISWSTTSTSTNQYIDVRNLPNLTKIESIQENRLKSSFDIANISQEFEGDYECRITDGSRKVIISQSLHLKDPPENFLDIKAISPLKKYLQHQNYDIKAIATGFPTPIKKYWIWTPFLPINTETEYIILKLSQSMDIQGIDNGNYDESFNDKMPNNSYGFQRYGTNKNKNYGVAQNQSSTYDNNSYTPFGDQYDEEDETNNNNYDEPKMYDVDDFGDIIPSNWNSLWNVSFMANTKSGVEEKYHIKNSTLVDSGNYTFVAENKYAIKNKTFQIYVQGLEMIGSHEVYIKWGEKKQISCEAYSYPEVTKFEWSIAPCFWTAKPQFSCYEENQNYFPFSFDLEPKTVGPLHYSSLLNFTHSKNLTLLTGFAFGLINCSAFNKNFNKNLKTHLYVGELIEPKIIFSNDKEINEMFKKNGTAKKSFKPGEKFNVTCEGIKSKYQEDIQWCKKLKKTSKNCLPLSPKDLYTEIYQTSTESTYQSTLMFLQLQKSNNGLYKCLFTTLLENKVEVISAFEINLEYELHPWLHYLTSAIIIGLLIVIAILMYYYYKYSKMRKRLKELGLENFANGKPDSINPEIAISEQAELLPYRKEYEVPKKKIQLGKLLGQGAFGYVYMASITPGRNNNLYCLKPKEIERPKIVAVKMIKQDTDPKTLQALGRELKILQHIDKHCYVINLLGAVTKTMYKCELMLIIEYCKYGSLDTFLLNNRNFFVDQIDSKTNQINLKQIDRSNSNNDFASNEIGNEFNDKLLSDPKEIDDNKKRYSENFYITSMKRKQEKFITFNTTDLIMWSQQIACGMNHLALWGIIHGDLAARNILLSDNFAIKISDFGLANQMYENEQYKKLAEKQLFPVKWYSIEAIEDRKLTTESDVWSYGVVLWELFSLGKIPYSDIQNIDHSFFYKIKKGYRLEQPRYANQSIYNIMLSCWKSDPLERPKFGDLSRMFKKYQGEKKVSHFKNPVFYDNVDYVQNRKSDVASISFLNNSYEMQPIYEEIDPIASTNRNDIVEVHSSPLMDEKSKLNNTLMSSNDCQNLNYVNSQVQQNDLYKNMTSSSKHENLDPQFYTNLPVIENQIKENFLNEMKITLNEKNSLKKPKNFEMYQNL